MSGLSEKLKVKDTPAALRPPPLDRGGAKGETAEKIPPRPAEKTEKFQKERNKSQC